MDISDTLAPNSDQLDACDLTTGPRIFTIKGVIKGNDEQPVQVQLVEFPRVWRPSKGMRRVLASCWGVDASAWVGRRVELYCDPTVIFGREAVGGTRISRLSDIDKDQKIPLLVSRGKSAVFTVRPLEASPARKASEPVAVQAASEAATSDATDADPLADAVKAQLTSLNAEEKASLRAICERLGIGYTGRSFIDAWGEGCRDLRHMIATVGERTA